jgi:hypothetical protein
LALRLLERIPDSARPRQNVFAGWLSGLSIRQCGLLPERIAQFHGTAFPRSNPRQPAVTLAWLHI